MKKLRILLISGLFVLAFCMLVACGAPSLGKPANLKINNKTLTWDEVDNARGYTVEINGAQHDVRRTSYSFEGTRLPEGTYTFKVKARGNEIDFVDSDWSTVTYTQGYESGLTYSLTDDGKAYAVKNVGYAKGDIVIEDTYNGLPVVAISDFAFTNSLDVKSVVIGKNVKKIGSRAFYGCTDMAFVVIPDSVTEMGEMVFQSCHSLTEVTIPNGVTNIGESAFAYCKSLEKVEIGEGVTAIGDSAFKSCEALKSVIIPQNVKSIGEEAFRNCYKLTSLDIDAESLTVEASAFRDCVELLSVDFGNCEMKIGVSMFVGCIKLTSINLPDTITEIGDGAFSGCTDLADVSLSANTTSIGGNAFFNTAAINNSENDIIILDKWIIATSNSTERLLIDGDINQLVGEDIIGIADYAFVDCIALRSISLPESVKYVGKGAFYRCIGLINVKVGDNAVSLGYGAFHSCTSLSTVLLGRSLEIIGPYAFAYCESLRDKNINIPAKVQSIGTYAFFHSYIWNDATAEGGTNTTGVMYVGDWVVGCNPQTQGSVIVKDGIVGIADYAFTYCSSLDTVKLPSSVKYIGQGAFYCCSNTYEIMGIPLPAFSVNIPAGVTEIKPYTFYATTMFSITIPDSVKKIGYAAFGGSSVMRVEMSDSVTEIDSFAFWACSSLQVINLSNNLTSISERAFSGCKMLRDIEIPSKVTSIGERAFFRCESLESVKFKGGLVEKIGDKAFYMCSGLKSISLPENTKEIGDFAFYKSGLESIEMNDSLEAIGDYAFYSCESLKALNLPGSVTNIGASAFRYCTKLKSVTLGRRVAEIGEHAFYGTRGLTLYCESTAIPAGWTARWNSSYRPVVLGCTQDETFTYIASVQKTDTSLYNYYAEGGISAPKRAGYTFVGWTTTEGATEAEYTAAEIAEAPNGTLYSVWKEGEEADPEEDETTDDKAADDLLDQIKDLLSGNK